MTTMLRGSGVSLVLLLLLSPPLLASAYTFYEVCDSGNKTCVVWPGNVNADGTRPLALPQTFLSRGIRGNPIDDSGWTLKINQCDEACDGARRFTGSGGLDCLTPAPGAAPCSGITRHAWVLPYTQSSWNNLRIEPFYPWTAGDASTYVSVKATGETLQDNQPRLGEVPRLCTTVVFTGSGVTVDGFDVNMVECAINATAFLTGGVGLHSSLSPFVFTGTSAAGTVVRNVHVTGGLVTARVVPQVGGSVVDLSDSAFGPNLVVDTATTFAAGTTLVVHVSLTNFYGTGIVINASVTALAQPVTNRAVAVTVVSGATFVNLTEITGATSAATAAELSCPACNCGENEAGVSTGIRVAFWSIVGVLVATAVGIAVYAIIHWCHRHRVVSALADASVDTDAIRPDDDDDDDDGDKRHPRTKIATTAAAGSSMPGGTANVMVATGRAGGTTVVSRTSNTSSSSSGSRQRTPVARPNTGGRNAALLVAPFTPVAGTGVHGNDGDVCFDHSDASGRDDGEF